MLYNSGRLSHAYRQIHLTGEFALSYRSRPKPQSAVVYLLCMNHQCRYIPIIMRSYVYVL